MGQFYPYFFLFSIFLFISSMCYRNSCVCGICSGSTLFANVPFMGRNGLSSVKTGICKVHLVLLQKVCLSKLFVNDKVKNIYFDLVYGTKL